MTIRTLHDRLDLLPSVCMANMEKSSFSRATAFRAQLFPDGHISAMPPGLEAADGPPVGRATANRLRVTGSFLFPSAGKFAKIRPKILPFLIMNYEWKQCGGDWSGQRRGPGDDFAVGE